MRELVRHVFQKTAVRTLRDRKALDLSKNNLNRVHLRLWLFCLDPSRAVALLGPVYRRESYEREKNEKMFFRFVFFPFREKNIGKKKYVLFEDFP